ncbi:23S rRNA (pseudouridine(1915)-N(3))-methyltransferase RlmH [Aestuariivirga sp.]|uniref:23S rRNA (pseudouridine(1915)-N(3))-methyltransferase RlmH n=1 Tax=Aestuariivirga sp. TaxID=2650926 RepID=UPI0039E3388F
MTRFTVSDQAESQQSTPLARMEDEARFFMQALKPQTFTIVLDERGQTLTSPAFATMLRRHLENGTPDVAFLIGGPDGHAQATRDSADLLLSLGAMTWPHRLARVMLYEQIYRALTIMVNHPYHRA